MDEGIRSPSLAFGFEIDLRFAVTMVVTHSMLMLQGATDLNGQQIVQLVDQIANVILDVAGMQPGATTIAGIQHVLQIHEHFNDRVVVGQRAVAKMVDAVIGTICRHDTLGQIR